VRVLRAFRHPNIIRLLGYSAPAGGVLLQAADVPNLCLVYELAANGSLDVHLRDAEKAARLDWPKRIKIATGVATALNYLHCIDKDHPAYHRDVKSANIALAADYCAKVIDCGLAKYIPPDGAVGFTVLSSESMRFGTPGYQCGKYLSNGLYGAKAEVFSFGIVLAELLMGQLQVGVGGMCVTHTPPLPPSLFLLCLSPSCLTVCLLLLPPPSLFLCLALSCLTVGLLLFPLVAEPARYN
jgi:serine/threonine protein kinase